MTQNEIDRLSIAKAKKFFASGEVYNLEIDTPAGFHAIHKALFK